MEEVESSGISTEENQGSGMSELEKRLQGTWTGSAQGCSAFEEGLHNWHFENGDCTWNEFTQAYSFSDDTLSFGGMRFLVRDRGRAIHLISIEDNCRIELSSSK